MIRFAPFRKPILALVFLAALYATGTGAQSPAPADNPDRPWTIPSNGRIKDLLTERMKHNGVGIVVGVIEPAGRRIVTCGKSGASDARPLDGDTVFQIGSVTKTFTTLLLAEMVRRGEVKLEDPAAKYLPSGVRMPTHGASDVDRPITLLHLATHSSGLPSMPTNFPLNGEPNPIEAYTVENLWQFLSNYTLSREPGEKHEYSNLGVSLLGRLLARRAGMEYEALLEQRVLSPLGLQSTSITLTPGQTARLAPGHNRYLQPVDTWEMRTLPASGSLRSTANDLLRYLAAHLGYVDSPLKAAMELQHATRFPPNSPQALGWGTRKIGNEEIFVHDGGKAGYRAAVAFNLRTRTGVVALANARTDDRPMEIALHLLAGRSLEPAPPAPPPRKIVPVDRKILDSYAGRYELKSGGILTIIRKGDHLLVDTGGDGGTEFLPTSARDFFLSSGNDDITFEVDAKDCPVALRHYPDGRDTGEFQTARRIATSD